MRMVADLGYDFTSLYVGGGTPTILIDELTQTMDLARELFSIGEISTETNPNHLDAERLAPLAERVKRLSVGVQSFDDGLLRQMDRYDKYGSGEKIAERLRAMQGVFHSLNVDMIFNFPSQTEEIVRRDVATLKSTGCNQTTFYPLMAAPSVQASLRHTVGEVDYGREAGFYRIVCEELADTFDSASAWTFTRSGEGMLDEYIVDYEEYVGIGSGAFSYLNGGLFTTTFSLREYNEAIASGRMPVAAASANTGLIARMRYRFLMDLFGLRLDKARFRQDFGVPVERGLWREVAFFRLARAFETDDAHEFTLTQAGRYLAVVMMRQMFADLNMVRDRARADLPADERKLLFGEGKPVCFIEHEPPAL
jgi:coproporphyrinogen III oxidase-like Fe-S oxidoreductase